MADGPTMFTFRVTVEIERCDAGVAWERIHQALELGQGQRPFGYELISVGEGREIREEEGERA